MSWWGKIIGGGFGFMLGGPLGAMLGAALGHQFDRGIKIVEVEFGAANIERTQAAFFTTVFSVMGYIAKADGQVTKNEIGIAEQLMSQMRLSADQRKAAIQLFNDGKQTEFNCDAVLEQFRSECHRQRNLMQMFLEILIATAMADGTLHTAEYEALKHISQKLGLAAYLDTLIQMAGAQRHYAEQKSTAHKPTLDDAYTLLGISSTATDDEVKKAYRRLMNQHHPDKLVSKGLPEEMIKLASEKTHNIKQAYEQIRAARGF